MKQNQKISNIITKKAFTIIELIVVITILAILGTIGFVSFSSHLVGVRDTSRQEQLGSIYQGLESYKTKNILPLPDDYVEVRASGSVVGYQGYAGKNILSTIGYSKGGQDPKDEQYFSYYISKDKKHVQLMGFLEDAGNKQFTIIPNTYVVDYTKRYATLFGKSLGILTESGTNTPIQEVASIMGSGYLDVVLPTTKAYIANFTDQDTIVGTGVKLIEKIVSITIPKSYKTCKEIYDNKEISRTVDGFYIVKPKLTEIQVYCDMTNNAATIVKANGTSNYLNEYSVCKTITLFTDEVVNSFAEIKKDYANVTIESDLNFYLQADGSTNKSYIDTLKISDFSNFKISMEAGGDNTRLNINSTKDKIYCDGAVASNKCGFFNKPAYQTYSDSLIIFKGVFNPFCEGSTATSNQWNRNQFSFKYTYYNVKFSN